MIEESLGVQTGIPLRVYTGLCTAKFPSRSGRTSTANCTAKYGQIFTSFEVVKVMARVPFRLF